MAHAQQFSIDLHLPGRPYEAPEAALSRKPDDVRIRKGAVCGWADLILLDTVRIEPTNRDGRIPRVTVSDSTHEGQRTKEKQRGLGRKCRLLCALIFDPRGSLQTGTDLGCLLEACGSSGVERRAAVDFTSEIF